MSLAEKIAAAAAQAQRNEAEAYSMLEYILRDRPMPGWLKSVCADVDGPRVPLDRPINQEASHG
jgi:hypothetical protein